MAAGIKSLLKKKNPDKIPGIGIVKTFFFSTFNIKCEQFNWKRKRKYIYDILYDKSICKSLKEDFVESPSDFLQPLQYRSDSAGNDQTFDATACVL